MYQYITSDRKTSFFSAKVLVTCCYIFKEYKFNVAGLETHD